MIGSRTGRGTLWAEDLESYYLAFFLLSMTQPQEVPRAEAGGDPGGGIRSGRQASGCRATLPQPDFRDLVSARAAAVAGVSCGLLPSEPHGIGDAAGIKTDVAEHSLAQPVQLPRRAADPVRVHDRAREPRQPGRTGGGFGRAGFPRRIRD